MADPRPGRDMGPGSPPRMPRWMKVTGIVIGALLVLFAIVLISGGPGGQHGPGRHMPGVTDQQATPQGSNG
jgi:hypothetical protein